MRTPRTDALEQCWIALGEHIDQTSRPDGEAAFLTRLTLLLANEVSDPARFIELAGQALAAGKAPHVADH